MFLVKHSMAGLLSVTSRQQGGSFSTTLMKCGMVDDTRPPTWHHVSHDVRSGRQRRWHKPVDVGGGGRKSSEQWKHARC